MSFNKQPFEYNLDRLTLKEKTARYNTIDQLAQINSYFGYLSVLSNPTNNHRKYTNEFLSTIAMLIQYDSLHTAAP